MSKERGKEVHSPSIVVIGGGKMGMSHLAIISSIVGKQKVALCDRSFFTRFLFSVLGYKVIPSLDEKFIRLNDLKAVVVATPTPSHAQLVEWSLVRGLPCFVEKPLTLDVDASEHLCDLAKSSGVEVQMGFVMRYVRTYQSLRECVHDNAFGAVLSYRGSMLGNVVTKRPDPKVWIGDSALGGGCLNEYGPHILDLCRFIFGDVDRVVSASLETVFCDRADDFARFELVHTNEVSGEVILNWSDESKRKSVIEFEVLFQFGKMVVDNSGVRIELEKGATEAMKDIAHRHTFANPRYVTFYLRGEEFSLQIQRFLQVVGFNTVIDDELIDEAADIDDGLFVDKLISKIRIQAEA